MPAIKDLTISLTDADIAVDDLVVVYDVSEANERKSTKKMRIDKLAIATGALLAGTFQPLDADLTSWAAVTRAAGFDTFVATPSGDNLATLLTTALPASKGGTGLTALSANTVTFLGAADYAAMRTQLSVYSTTQVDAADSAVAAAAAAALATHTGNTSNPHSVTKAQVGLGSVENTALSTWAGSANLVTVGALTSGSINWSGNIVTSGIFDVGTSGFTQAGYGLLNLNGASGGMVKFGTATVLKGQIYGNAGGITYDAPGALNHYFYVNSAQVAQISTAGLNLGSYAITGGAISGTTLAASGPLLVSGAVPSHAASRATLSYEGSSASYLQAYGANAGTQGTLNVRLWSSDGSLTTTPASFTSTGLAVTGTGTFSSTVTLTNGVLQCPGATDLVLYGGGSNIYGKIGGTTITTTNSDGFAVTGKLGVGTAANSRMGIYNTTAITVSSGSGFGIRNDPTITAAANSDGLYGHYTSPTFATGTGLTGLVGYTLRLATPTVTGSSGLATSYALFIDGPASATTTWGIYQNGTNANYLGGNLIVGGNGTVNPGSGFDAVGIGFAASTGKAEFSADGDASVTVNRKTSDGASVVFRRSATQVGTISVTTTATAYNTSSDARLKTDLGAFDLSTIAAPLYALTLRKYAWNVWLASDDPDTRARVAYGVFAQEAQKTCPWLVTHDAKNDTWAVQWMALTPNIVAALQVHETELTDHEQRIASLEKELAELKAA